MTGQAPITFKVRTEGVQRVLDAMPKVAYFWFRDYLGRSFVQHRVRWLQSKGTKFGRGQNGVRVPNVNEGSGPIGDKEVRYTVSPAARKMPTRAAAQAAMKDLQAEAATGNTVLAVHQFGTDIRTRNRGLFIPIAGRNRPKKFSRWVQRYRNKSLLIVPSKKDADTRLVYEVQKERRLFVGRPRKGDAPPKQRLLLRWVVKKQVDMKPTLRFYESWDGMAGDRERLFAEVASKMVRDMERADPRDL